MGPWISPPTHTLQTTSTVAPQHCGSPHCSTSNTGSPTLQPTPHCGPRHRGPPHPLLPFILTWEKQPRSQILTIGVEELAAPGGLTT